MNQAKLLPEWSTQDGVLLAWPHAGTDWASLLPRIEQVYRELIRHITRFENVVLLCHDQTLAQHTHRQLAADGIDLTRLHILCIPYNDTWLRDSGPLSVARGQQICAADFRFNGWGGKFDAKLDNGICSTLSRQPIFKAAYQAYDMILEGGSLDCDGVGSLLTTRQCLLTETRNPEMSTDDYEQFFAREFGVKRVIWLENGELEGDDTDGHVDMLARFCDSRTIAYTSCEREDDSHYPSLKALEMELQNLRDPQGRRYELVPLPIPEPIFGADGHRLPASYANFLIINGAVLLPLYKDANDSLVSNRLQSCFPGREIIGIDARAVIEQHGSLHCLTMQLARGSLAVG